MKLTGVIRCHTDSAASICAGCIVAVVGGVTSRADDTFFAQFAHIEMGA